MSVRERLVCSEACAIVAQRFFAKHGDNARQWNTEPRTFWHAERMRQAAARRQGGGK
ncbi:MAG: hypothetical protein HYV42_00060 [Candidatus Magasanikbacteria bacterium]|nr:hypothetical protein [Candidatus Magasanikbacteria bacterium]